jgi:hypothetical protein
MVRLLNIARRYRTGGEKRTRNIEALHCGRQSTTQYCTIKAHKVFCCQYADEAGGQCCAHSLLLVKGHCDAVARDYDAIEHTALGMVQLGPGGMSPTNLIGFRHGLAGIGIQQFIFNNPTVHEIAPLEMIGREVMQAVADL